MNELRYHFFALYLGQKVLNDGEYFTLSGLTNFGCSSPVAILSNAELCPDTSYHRFIKDCQLLLKPLSQISDEDAIGIAKIEYPVAKEMWTVENGRESSLFITLDEYKTRFITLEVYHFLISKGYLLSFQGLDPVAEGWAVLEEKTIEK